MTPSIHLAVERIKQTGLIAIVRGDFSVSKIVKVGAALVSAQLNVMEVTLNSADALAAIAQLRREFGERLLVGAGTVRTAAQVIEAQAANAQFIVSPNLDLASVAHSQAQGLLHLPGVFTATEAQTAFAAGCRLVKFFPADLLGPAYLKAVRAPLDDVEFVPTGGITADNIAEYVRAGAAAVGVGGALIVNSSQTDDDVYARAVQLRNAWEQAQHDS